MALIAYDDADATAFQATRRLSDDDLATWRAAIGRHFEPGPGMRMLDLGCGTGSWARAFATWWPGVQVLIRSAFAGRHAAISLFRWFPEAVAVLNGYPSVADVEAAFAGAGFAAAGCEPVPQVTAGSVAEAAARLRREAHTRCS